MAWQGPNPFVILGSECPCSFLRLLILTPLARQSAPPRGCDFPGRNMSSLGSVSPLHVFCKSLIRRVSEMSPLFSMPKWVQYARVLQDALQNNMSSWCTTQRKASERGTGSEHTAKGLGHLYHQYAGHFSPCWALFLPHKPQKENLAWPISTHSRCFRHSFILFEWRWVSRRNCLPSN